MCMSNKNRHFFGLISTYSERGIIGSLEKIYSKYVSKLESEDVHTSGCPLCHRTFDTNKEIAALVTEVSALYQDVQKCTSSKVLKVKSQPEVVILV